MKKLMICFLMIFLTANVASATLLVAVTPDPAVPEYTRTGVVASVTITVTDDNAAAPAGIPISLEGDLGSSGVLDSRGSWTIYYNVPNHSRLQFDVIVGSTRLPHDIPIAIGHWEANSSFSGSFSGGYAFTKGDNFCPSLSWGSDCANAHGDGDVTSQEKAIPISPIKTSGIDTALAATAGWVDSPTTGAIHGGAALTEIRTFKFVPTAPSGHVPSKSYLFKSGKVTGMVQAYFVPYDSKGRASSALTAVSAFGTPVTSTAASGSTKSSFPPAIDLPITLPKQVAYGGTIQVPMARAISGQCSFGLTGIDVVQDTQAKMESKVSDNLEKRAFSIDPLPVKAVKAGG